MPKVAIWVHGGIGGGHFSQGQPPLQELIERLSEEFDIDVYSLTSPNVDFSPKSFRMYYPEGRGWRIMRWLWLIQKFVRKHNRSAYDVVYGMWGYPAGSLAVMLGRVVGRPTVVHLQGGDAAKLPASKYGVFNHPIRALICRITYAVTTRLIALSFFQAECLRANGVRRPPLIMPYGPDLRNFYFVPNRFDMPIVRFLHVGNQTPVKGQYTMLKTFSLVRRQIPSRLTIVGDDYYDGQLKVWCKQLDIEHDVDFVGPQRHSDMPSFYHHADVLLHTPLFEGQGLVFAEAAACGTLIAGTRVGMLADMGDDCALIVPVGDAEGLAEKIVDAMQNKDDLRQMRYSAYEWVRKKDVTYTVATLVQVLDGLVPHAGSRRSKAQADKAKG
jgi:glycosyltransferase involved in cell wall biosynthesis